MIHIYGHFNHVFILILHFFFVSFSLCCSFVVCFPFDYVLFLIFFDSGVCFEVALCFKYVDPILYLLASVGSHIGQTHSGKWKNKKQPCIFLLSCPTVYDFDVPFHIFILLLFIVVTIIFTKTFSFFFFNLYVGLLKWLTFQLWFFSFLSILTNFLFTEDL